MRVEQISPGNHKSEDDHRSELCTAGWWFYQRGFIPSTDGNLSIRLDGHRILTTPAGKCKGGLTPSDLVITDHEGRKLNGDGEPSTELGMHLFIYKHRPDVNAVCHAHPSVATGFAAAGLPLEKPILAEMVVNLGPVPLAPFALPGSAELPPTLERLVEKHDAILLANHGVVTVGPDLFSAFHRMDLVEHYARVMLVTELVGKQSLLSSRDVEKLLAARAATPHH